MDEKQSKAASGQGLVSLSKDTISLQILEPPPGGEVNYGMLPTSTETSDQLDLKFDDADSYLPHH